MIPNVMNLFIFAEGLVKENKFKYCPYCGREIIEWKYINERSRYERI